MIRISIDPKMRAGFRDIPSESIKKQINGGPHIYSFQCHLVSLNILNVYLRLIDTLLRFLYYVLEKSTLNTNFFNFLSLIFNI